MTQKINIKYPGMNKFIKLTDMNEQVVYINSAMIAIIQKGISNGSFVLMLMSDAKIKVKESQEEILKMID
jgi:hypothetical protein